MAYNIKVGKNYELFGFGDIRKEILDTIRHTLGREFADFVEDNLTPDIGSAEDGLDDIIRLCEDFDPEIDNIEKTLNDIRITAEYTKQDLANYY